MSQNAPRPSAVVGRSQARNSSGCGSMPRHNGPRLDLASASRLPKLGPEAVKLATPGAYGTVQLLQGQHPDVAADSRLDALHGGRGALNGCDAGNVDGHRDRPDLVAVDARSGIAVWRVDHHVDLTGADRVNRRQHRSPFLWRLEVLAHLVAWNAVAPQHLRGSFSGEDLKTQLGEPLDP